MAHHFVQHEINRTGEKSARFWDYLSSRASYRENNFSKLAGEALISFIRRYGVTLRGIALDFGCGPGFLLETLLKRGVYCRGVEFFRTAADLANQSVGGHPLFQGVVLLDHLPLPIKENSCDIIFVVETIEHILPDDLAPTLDEFYRILKTGGYIIITTPNEESLERGKIICPDCGCIFHQGQHLSARTADSLSNLMAKFCFRSIACRITNFRPPSK